MTLFNSHQSRVRLLYKTILRLHRGLPPEIQPLGNGYVHDEFKRHKNCNQAEAVVFMTEWTNYAVQLSQQLGLGVRGKPKEHIGDHLREDDLQHFKDDQIVQLYELMKAATIPNDETETSESNDKTKTKS